MSIDSKHKIVTTNNCFPLLCFIRRIHPSFYQQIFIFFLSDSVFFTHRSLLFKRQMSRGCCTLQAFIKVTTVTVPLIGFNLFFFGLPAFSPPEPAVRLLFAFFSQPHWPALLLPLFTLHSLFNDALNQGRHDC